MESVCKGCSERYTACWGSCQKYLDAKATYEKQKKAREKDMMLNDMLDSVHYTGLQCERKRKKLKWEAKT